MGGAVFSDLDFPDLPPTKFIATQSNQVLFMNFTVDHTELQPEHITFISGTLVQHFIRQIEKLGFSDNQLKLQLLGRASASGNSSGNMALSSGRAIAVGKEIARQFDMQKAGTKFAKNVKIVPVVIANGDIDAKAALQALRSAHPELFPLSNKDIDLLQPAFRSVKCTLKLHHEVDDDDTKVDCRQILTAKIKIEKKPANHLEEVIDEMQKKTPPALKFVLDQGYEFIKKAIAKQI
jgi:hypothetical protein